MLSVDLVTPEEQLSSIQNEVSMTIGTTALSEINDVYSVKFTDTDSDAASTTDSKGT